MLRRLFLYALLCSALCVAFVFENKAELKLSFNQPSGSIRIHLERFYANCCMRGKLYVL